MKIRRSLSCLIAANVIPFDFVSRARPAFITPGARPVDPRNAGLWVWGPPA